MAITRWLIDCLSVSQFVGKINYFIEGLGISGGERCVNASSQGGQKCGDGRPNQWVDHVIIISTLTKDEAGQYLDDTLRFVCYFVCYGL